MKSDQCVGFEVWYGMVPTKLAQVVEGVAIAIRLSLGARTL